MRTLSYACIAQFPNPAVADATKKYLDASTGVVYYVSTVGTPSYKLLWPVPPTPDVSRIGRA